MSATNTCPVCSAELTSKPKDQICCSRKCAGALTRGGTAEKNKQTCPVCGKDFLPNSPGQVTCSYSCRGAIRKPGPAAAELHTKICAFCGEEFQHVSWKGERKYCSKSCSASGRNQAAGKTVRGEMTEEGFVSTNVQGYQTIRIDGVRKPLHRHIMEKHLGRGLHKHEHIHHKNGDRVDNRLENLEVWSTLIRQQPPGIHATDYALNLWKTFTDDEKTYVLKELST